MNSIQSIAHYRITGKLGEGGMGAVYRAVDTKLNREVAIKVLPAALASDPDYIARFTREAQVLASLNHPNIATIHGVEENALIMELVPGPTLEDKIAAGPVPLPEALAIARQIAEALEAAHEKTIIHRDLKPANVKVTPQGLVKVLDFGLAKIAEPSAHVSTVNSPTLTVRATQAGLIMGTAGYMSPEQARGMPVDKRADIWAFGVVLLEMLTGRQTFAGETISDTLAAVLKTDPDFGQLPPETPPSIRRLLKRCLERDRRKRLHDIGDARLEIDAAGEIDAASAPAPAPAPVAAPRSWTRFLPWAVAALGIPLAYLLHTPPPPPEAVPVRFQVFPPPENRFAATGTRISPDGRYLAAVCISSQNGRILWLRDLNSLAWRPLAGTDGAASPFWSPDSAAIAFVADGKLKRVALSGGLPQTVTDAPGNGRGAAWTPQGVILLARSAFIGRVDASGGAIIPIVNAGVDGIGAASPRYPSVLPGGDRFLFDGRNGVYLSPIDASRKPAKVMDAEGGALFTSAASGTNGYLLFRRGDALMAAPFDPKRAQLAGEAFTLTDGVASDDAVSAATGGRALAIYEGGESTYKLRVLDRTGNPLQDLPSDKEALSHLELSPDGSRLLGNMGTQAINLWSVDIKRSTISRVTNGGKDAPAVWSADGRKVYFAGETGGKPGLFVTDADGSGQPQRLIDGSFHHMDASRDGKYLVMELASSVGGALELGVYHLAKGGPPEIVVKSTFNVGSPRFSSDTRWLGYGSTETGRPEIYVQSFPPGKGRWQVSTAGGTQMKWRADGKEIFYKNLGGAIYSVSVKPQGAGLEFGPPVRLFETGVATNNAAGYFAVSNDGSRFFLHTISEDRMTRPITILLNWTAGLKK